jgi:hypothetical protein
MNTMVQSDWSGEAFTKTSILYRYELVPKVEQVKND